MITIIQTISSALVPILLFLFGLLLLRKIEVIKASVLKQKEWQTRWADSFFQLCQALVADAEGILNTWFEVGEALQRESHELEHHRKRISESFDILQKMKRIELRLRTHLLYCPKSAAEVRETASALLQAFHDTGRLWCSRTPEEPEKVEITGQWNVESMQEYIIQFHEAARKAHREMLDYES